MMSARRFVPIAWAGIALACAGEEGRGTMPVEEVPPGAEAPAPGPAPAPAERRCGVIGSGGVRALVRLGGPGSFAVGHGTGRIVLRGAGAITRVIEAHAAPIARLDASADGALLASGSVEGELTLWRAADGTPVRTWTAPVEVFALSPEGDRLLVSDGGTARLIRVADGAVLWAQPVLRGGGAAAFSADGATVFQGGDVLTVRRAADGALLRSLTVSPYGVRAISPDGEALLAFAARTGSVALLRTRDGTEIWASHGADGSGGLAVVGAAFSPDGTQVAYALRDGPAVVVRASDGARLRSLAVDGGAAAVAFSSDGGLLAAGSPLGALRVLDLGSGAMTVDEPVAGGHTGRIVKAEFSPDGALIVSQADEVTRDRSLKVWRAADGALLYGDVRDPGDGARKSFALSPDGELIAVGGGSRARTVYLLAAASGAVRRTIAEADATSLAFSPDGRDLAFKPHCIGCVPHAIRVVRIADGVEQPGFGDSLAHDGHALVFSPDGRLLAGTAEGNRSPAPAAVAVWRTADRALLWSVPGEPGDTVTAAFSRDGAYLAVTSTGRGRVAIRRAGSGELVRELDLPGARAVAFSPDGLLVAGTGAGLLRVWDAHDGRVSAELPGAFTTAAFSPDGGILLAGGADGTLHRICGLRRILL